MCDQRVGNLRGLEVKGTAEVSEFELSKLFIHYKWIHLNFINGSLCPLAVMVPFILVFSHAYGGTIMFLVAVFIYITPYG